MFLHRAIPASSGRHNKFQVVEYLETALVILDQDNLGELGEDDIQSISKVVDTAVDALGIQVQELCGAGVVFSTSSNTMTNNYTT